MKLRTLQIMMGLGLVLLTSLTQAQQPIVSYNFRTIVNGDSTGQPDAQPSNATARPFRRVGLNYTGAGGVFNSAGWEQGPAPAAGKYVTFGIVANQGFKLNITEISFNERRSNSGPAMVSVRTNIDAFAADLDTFATFVSPTGTTTRRHTLRFVPGYFNNQDEVTLRFHGYNATAVAGTMRFDSVVVTGTIVASGPYVSTSPLSLNFGSVLVGNTSAVQTYSVSGKRLTAPIDIAAPAGYLLSLTGAPSLTSLQVPLDGDSVNPTTINVAFAPTVAGAASGNITNVSGTLSSAVAVSGTGTNPAPAGPTRILPYKSRNVNGGADSLGKTATLRGVVYGVNTYNPVTGGVQFTLIDPTAGINIRMQGNTTYTVTEGDSVEVTGAVAQFRGLIQINATAINLISSGSTLKQPTVLTRMDYPYVSDLVRFNDLRLVPGTWPAAPTGSGFTARAVRATSTDTIDIRVVPQTADVWTMAAPAGAFDLVGLGGQFSPTATPNIGGFQVSPRRISDITQAVNPPVGFQRILPYKSRNLTTGIADSLAKTATFRGVVYGINTLATGTQFTLIDPTAGINVRWANNTSYTVTEGDSVEVSGTVGQFRGLIQFAPTAITRISGGSRLKNPTVINRMDYPFVSDLVRVNNLRLVPGTWPATPTVGFTARAVRGTSTDTINIRVNTIVADVFTSPAPTGAFDLIGLGGQFATSGDLGGLEVHPRRLADIITTVTPPPVGYKPILPYKSRNVATGVADSLGKVGTVRGVVYGVNTYNPVTGGVQLTLIDQTAGINIRMQGNTTYTVTEGDSLEVTGTLAQFRGLIQFNATAITRISGGSTLKSPIVVNRMDYPLVSDLVRINDLNLVPGTWPAAPTGSGFTARAVRGTSTDTIDIRVVPQTADVWAMPAPATTFDLIGLGGQFSPTATPNIGGFQVSPRRVADIIPVVSLNDKVVGQVVKLYPNPAKETIRVKLTDVGQATISFISMTGQTVLAETVTGSALEAGYSISNLTSGVYQVIIRQGGQTYRARLIKE